MTIPPVTTRADGVRFDRATEERKLKDSARQMEAVFVQQLLQAMHATVGDDGLVPRGSGEDIFQSMLDQDLAARLPGRIEGPRALSTQLFEALRRRLPAPTDPAAATADAPPTVPSPPPVP